MPSSIGELYSKASWNNNMFWSDLTSILSHRHSNNIISHVYLDSITPRPMMHRCVHLKSFEFYSVENFTTVGGIPKIPQRTVTNTDRFKILAHERVTSNMTVKLQLVTHNCFTLAIVAFLSVMAKNTAFCIKQNWCPHCWWTFILYARFERIKCFENNYSC